MAENNSITIGGVRFNKNDVKSSEQIQKDGKTLNSVFLKDGTQVVFPNQSSELGEGDKAKVQKSGENFLDKLSPFEHHTGEKTIKEQD